MADALVEAHIRGFFAGHEVRVHQWPEGPALEQLPNLCVLEISPGPRINLVTYVTCGAWAARPEAPLEFLMIAKEPSPRYVELLTMLAFYSIDHALGTGHIIPVGEPILPGSKCTYTYISLPYPFGPELEIVELASGGHVHLFWDFPITEDERDFARVHGAEALEQAFEDHEVEYWNPCRASVAS